MRATSRAQPISRSQRRLDAAVVRIAIRFIVVVVIVHLISTRRGWVTQRRWRHKLSFHAAARRTRRTGSLRRWLHHRRDVLLDFFALETRVSRGKVMRVAVFTVPISRARTVRDGRRVGVRRVTGSQVGRRRWTFRHLRLRNGASWRTARRREPWPRCSRGSCLQNRADSENCAKLMSPIDPTPWWCQNKTYRQWLKSIGIEIAA